MDKKTRVSELTMRFRREQEILKSMACSEILAYLNQNWGTMWDGQRAYLVSLVVDKGCRGGVLYLLHQLGSSDPSSRWRALYGLAHFKCREYRQTFIDFHLNDPDDDVKQASLISLCDVFRGERDVEILRLALAAWDDPASSVTMRLTAGAVMMYQLNISHDERGRPGWWNEEEEDLQHPSILQAVAETRRLLAQETSR